MFEPWKGVAMTGCTKRRCTAILLILLGMHGLSAHVSLGFELGLPGTVAPAAIYELQSFRAELAAHFFALNLATAAVTEDGFKDLQFNEIIGKAILSTRLTPTERHVLYGGAGLLGYFDLHSQEYMVAAGPALQYAWKFPDKKGELHIDLLLPLVYKHNYEDPIPEDDWPSSAGLVYVLLVAMAPTIGFTWSF